MYVYEICVCLREYVHDNQDHFSLLLLQVLFEKTNLEFHDFIWRS